MSNGKTLREARTAAGLSQMALATKAGVSQTYISDLETESLGNPTIAVLRRLERALRCRLRFSGHSPRRAA
jgi:transcriptional regulator with XRE-family HTH domain